jgi:hypothetical protein
VDEVSGRRRERGEAVGAQQRALGSGRGFDGVDVEVVGADVLGRAAEHGFERGDYRVGAGGGPPLVVEEPPRVENHRGVGPEGGGVRVVRVAAGELGHRVAVGDPEPVLVGRGVG